LPDNLRALLPSPEEIEKIISTFDDDFTSLLGSTGSGGCDDVNPGLTHTPDLDRPQKR
jgi:hypothetical protein